MNNSNNSAQKNNEYSRKLLTIDLSPLNNLKVSMFLCFLQTYILNFKINVNLLFLCQ